MKVNKYIEGESGIAMMCDSVLCVYPSHKDGIKLSYDDIKAIVELDKNRKSEDYIVYSDSDRVTVVGMMYVIGGLGGVPFRVIFAPKNGIDVLKYNKAILEKCDKFNWEMLNREFGLFNMATGMVKRINEISI